MANTQTQPQSLSSLINRSQIISDEKKSEFLDLLPVLTQDQIKEVTDFFVLAENKIQKITDEYEAKKPGLYTSHLSELNQAFGEAHKLAFKTKEEKSSKSDEKNAQALLEELDQF